jgi:hypothetical protein
VGYRSIKAVAIVQTLEIVVKLQDKGCSASRKLDYRSIKAVAIVQTLKISFGPNGRGDYF